MIISFSMILETILATIISIVAFYFVGAILTSFFKIEDSNKYYNTFVRLTIGFTTITTIYALIKTTGNSVLSLFIAIAILWWYTYRKKISIPKIQLQSLINSHITSICGLSLVFGIYFLFFVSGNPLHDIPHIDDVFYTSLSTKLGYFGIETSNSLFDGEWDTATPYHYVELWFLNLLTSIFNTNPMYTYSVIERTIGCTILTSGMIAIASLFSTNKLAIVLWGLLSITICPFLLDYSEIRQLQCLAYRPSTMFMSCFYIWSFALYLKKEQTWFYPLIAIPIFHLGCMPVLYSSLVTIAIIQLLFSKNIKAFLEKVAPTFTMAILFIVFYYVLNKPTNSQTSQTNIISYCLQFYSLKEFVDYLYANIANYLMFTPYFLPLIVLIIYSLAYNKNIVLKIWNDYKTIILFFCISTAYGLVLGYYSYPFVRNDAHQLHTLVNHPFLYILSFISILIALSHNDKSIRYHLTIFYSLCCLLYSTIIYCISRRSVYNPSIQYDPTYISNVTDYYNTKSTPFRGGKISSTDYIIRFDFLNGYLPGPYCFESDFMYITMMNTYIPNDSIVSDVIEKTYGKNKFSLFIKQNYASIINNDPFARYAKQFVEKHGPTSIDSIRAAFINNYKLGYLIYDSNAKVTNEIIPYIDTQFVDAKTGERFIFLKQN